MANMPVAAKRLNNKSACIDMPFLCACSTMPTLNLLNTP